MLINVFRIIRKSQVGEFDQGWTLQDSGSRERDLSITVLESDFEPLCDGTTRRRGTH